MIKLSISLRKRAGATRGAPANTATAVSAGTNCRRRNGISSPTGTPLRVTTKDCPLSSARMIRPLSLRSSRCVIRRLMPTYCSTCATARALRVHCRLQCGAVERRHQRRRGRARCSGDDGLRQKCSGTVTRPGGSGSVGFARNAPDEGPRNAPTDKDSETGQNDRKVRHDPSGYERGRSDTDRHTTEGSNLQVEPAPLVRSCQGADNSHYEDGYRHERCARN